MNVKDLKIKRVSLLALTCLFFQPKKDLEAINAAMCKSRDKLDKEQEVLQERFNKKVDVANDKVSTNLEVLISQKAYQIEVQEVILQDSLARLNAAGVDKFEAEQALSEFKCSSL